MFCSLFFKLSTFSKASNTGLGNTTEVSPSPFIPAVACFTLFVNESLTETSFKETPAANNIVVKTLILSVFFIPNSFKSFS